ncbi:hypothetical protein ACIA5D_16695 [Actinoplanes sp. NPDC051513]|uniref:hypothetical protein n=1 Tax=Actinoplanes sp. NPDC051513 TaxID=3363908 RepID=UPI0037958F98
MAVSDDRCVGGEPARFTIHAGRLVITCSTDRRVKLALQADGDLSSDYEQSNSPGPDLREVQGKIPSPSLSRCSGSSPSTRPRSWGDKNDWPKTGNWKAAAHLSLGDLSGTDLGQFLERA